MTNNLSMFKMYDIRTKAENLNTKIIEHLSKALAVYYRDYVKVKSVVIARDARIHCAQLMDSLVSVMSQYGLEVFFNPVQISTCQFYFSAMQHRDAGGIMITASHNPGCYVGYKLVGADVTPIASGCGPAGGINKVKELYISENLDVPSFEKGKLHIIQYQKEYVDYSMKLAGVSPGSLSGLKVFGEFFSGAAGADFIMAMDKAGATYTVNNFVPDGLFLHGDPNPIIEESIAPSRILMKQGDYDIGFCYDGDGDRMDLMFSDGEQIIPGLNMSIIVPYIMDIFKSYYDIPLKAYVDVKAIPLALIEIAKTSIEPHIIRNGHSFIKEKLHDYAAEGYIVSEEESAHYYMNFPFDMDDFSKGFASTENTLFFTLLTARAFKEHKEKYERVKILQKGIIRKREWPLYFNVYEEMENIMKDVENEMIRRGARVIKTMDDSSDLDATLMRFSLPDVFDKNSQLSGTWCQVAQRISRSEDAMTRWEVVASDEKTCNEINNVILAITDKYVQKGYAHY